MANPKPKTRGWHSRGNAHKPKGYHLIAAGLVPGDATNMEPPPTAQPERRPQNLGLHLTIEEVPGEGADVVVWKAVHFHKEVKKGEFDHVVIRWGFDEIATVPIIDDTQHAAEGAAAMKALNAKYAGKAGPAKPAGGKPAGGTPAAKKAAPKQAAAKKKTAPKKASAAKKKPRSVGGWAKGKKAKKAPKKAAKKSGLKKLVRKLVKKLTPAKKKRR